MSIITSGDKGEKDITKILKTLYKTLDKKFVDDYKHNPLNPWNDNYENSDLQIQAEELYWKQFDAAAKRGLLQANRFAMIKQQMDEAGLLPYLCQNKKIKQTYFITIRPNEHKINFPDFYWRVKELVEAPYVKEFVLSFEQKGTTIETLGIGFHTHIVAETTHRSKGELLRVVQNHFKTSTAPNCIDVELLRTKEDFDRVLAYMETYTSKDGHKEETAEWDPLWRKRKGLLPIYKQIWVLPILASEVDSSSAPTSSISAPLSSPLSGQLRISFD